jgi:hypothetical protein
MNLSDLAQSVAEIKFGRGDGSGVEAGNGGSKD